MAPVPSRPGCANHLLTKERRAYGPPGGWAGGWAEGNRDIENWALPLHLGKTPAGKEEKTSGSRSILENPNYFLSTIDTDNRSGVILRKCTPSAAQALGVALGGGHLWN